MPGSTTGLRQERLKKTSARPNPLGLFTINEEDEQQKNGSSKRLKGMPWLCSLGWAGLGVQRAAQPPQRLAGSRVCYREPDSDWRSLAVRIGTRKCPACDRCMYLSHPDCYAIACFGCERERILFSY